MITFIYCFILTQIFLLTYYITKSLLHPATIFSLIWLLQLIGLTLMNDHFIPVSNITLLIVTVGAFTFSLTALVFYPLLTISHTKYGLKTEARCRWIIKSNLLPYVFSALIVLWCMIAQFQIFTDIGGGADFGINLVVVRTKFSIENEDLYGFYKYGSPLAFVAMLCLSMLMAKKEQPLCIYCCSFIF